VSRLSRKCGGSLDVSQPYGPPRPVTGTALPHSLFRDPAVTVIPISTPIFQNLLYRSSSPLQISLPQQFRAWLQSPSLPHAGYILCPHFPLTPSRYTTISVQITIALITGVTHSAFRSTLPNQPPYAGLKVQTRDILVLPSSHVCSFRSLPEIESFLLDLSERFGVKGPEREAGNSAISKSKFYNENN
jgi:hypothetical protein